MLVTNIASKRKDNKNYLRFHMTDLDQSFGPLFIRWHDYYISKALSKTEVEGLEKILISSGIKDYKIKGYSRQKQVIHARGQLTQRLHQNFHHYFYKQSPTEIVRLTFCFPDYALKCSPDLLDCLFLQKDAHQIMRHIHNLSLDKRFGSVQDRNRFLRSQYKHNHDLKNIQGHLETILKDHHNDNRIFIDPISHQCSLYLESTAGVRKSDECILTPQTIDDLITKGKLAVSDIEFGDYTTKDPFVYLDTFVYKDQEKLAGEIFSRYPIGSDTLLTEDGKVPFIVEQDPDMLRAKIADYRFKKSFVFLFGHNFLGFDEQKCLNPKRESRPGRLKGDGFYRIGCDNSEPFYVSDRGGMEVLNSAGTFLMDTMRIGRNYFSDLFSDMKLETMMAWFNEFDPDFEYTFKKSFGSYTDIEQARIKWSRGDVSLGKDLSLYGYHDSKAPLHLSRQLIVPLVNIARSCGVQLFDCGICSPRNLAVIFWQRKHFKDTNVPSKKDFKEKKEYHTKGTALKDKLTLTADIADYDLQQRKDALLCHIAGRDKVPAKAALAYLPLFASSCRFIVSEHAPQLYSLMDDSKSPLEKIMYAQVLDHLAIQPIIDMVSVSYGYMPSTVFYARYKKDPDASLTALTKSIESQVRANSPYGWFGNYIVTDNPSDAIVLGDADFLPVKGKACIVKIGSLLTSKGIKIPSEKSWAAYDCFSRDQTYLEVKVIFESAKAYFAGGVHSFLQTLDTYAKSLAAGDIPIIDLLKTKRRTKEYYENPDSFSSLLFSRYDISVGEKITFLVEEGLKITPLTPQDLGYSLETVSSGKKESAPDFSPLISYYQNEIFGGYKIAPKTGMLDLDSRPRPTPLFRIAQSLFFWEKPYRLDLDDLLFRSYHNLKIGTASSEDLDRLASHAR